MAEEPKFLNDETQDPRSVFALAAPSIAVGAFSGLVATSFRLLLHSSDGWRTYFILRAHDWGLLGYLWVILSIALLAPLAAWLVARFAPDTAGSGIPHVERQCFPRGRHIHDREHGPGQHLEKKYGKRRTPEHVPPARRFPRNRMLRDFTNRLGNLESPAEPFSDVLREGRDFLLSIVTVGTAFRFPHRMRF